MSFSMSFSIFSIHLLIFSNNLSQSDQEISTAINHELDRQKYQIELIASENIVSKAVIEAQGSVSLSSLSQSQGQRPHQSVILCAWRALCASCV